jgi:uncharacterized protein (DUF2267 family)
MDTRAFYKNVAERVGCDETRADAITFAVFQELRDRLTPAEAEDVAAQLPKPLRQLWLEGEMPERRVHRMNATEFVGRVQRRLSLTDDREARRFVLGVFAALQRLLGSPKGRDGESWDILSQLPKDLKQLWLAAGDRAA